MIFNIPRSPSTTEEYPHRNIRGLPNTQRNRAISPAKIELLAAQRRMSHSVSQLDSHSNLGTRQRETASENAYEERPSKRTRTIGERVGEAVYNTVVVAGGIGAAAYRYWKGDGSQEKQPYDIPSTSYSPDQSIPGSFNYREAEKEDDYVDIDKPVFSPTNTPTRTPKKKVYRVNSRFRSVQSPKSKPRKQPKDKDKDKDKPDDSNNRLDTMSARLSAMIADGQKALVEPAQLDEEDLEDEVLPPSTSFTFTQTLPRQESNYSIGEGLRAAASLYSK